MQEELGQNALQFRWSADTISGSRWDRYFGAISKLNPWILAQGDECVRHEVPDEWLLYIPRWEYWDGTTDIASETDCWTELLWMVVEVPYYWFQTIHKLKGVFNNERQVLGVIEWSNNSLDIAGDSGPFGRHWTLFWSNSCHCSEDIALWILERKYISPGRSFITTDSLFACAWLMLPTLTLQFRAWKKSWRLRGQRSSFRGRYVEGSD